MARKSIELSEEQVKFITRYLKNSKHGSKMKLADEFEKVFRVKHSYKTLIKYANNAVIEHSNEQ